MNYITSKEQLEQVIANGNALVQFSATWCQPCKVLARTMENIRPQHDDVTFYKIDIDTIGREVLERF